MQQVRSVAASMPADSDDESSIVVRSAVATPETEQQQQQEDTESDGSSIVVRSAVPTLEEDEVQQLAAQEAVEDTESDGSSIEVRSAVATLVEAEQQEEDEVQQPAADTAAERERLRLVALVKDFARRVGDNPSQYHRVYEGITVTGDSGRFIYDHPFLQIKNIPFLPWLQVSPFFIASVEVVLFLILPSRLQEAMETEYDTIHYEPPVYDPHAGTDFFDGIPFAVAADPGTPPLHEAIDVDGADAIFVEGLRVARETPLFKLHCWPRKMSLVDASVFVRSRLVDPQLFIQQQHVIFTAPGRSGKSAGIGFGVVSDLRYRRPVLFLACQSSDSSWRSACRSLKDQLEALSLYGKVDSPIAFFEFEDVRDNHAGVVNSIMEVAHGGRRAVVCLRMDRYHLNLLRGDGFQLHAGTAVWMDEPQNKFTFKQDEEGAYTKQAVDALMKLGAEGALFRAVSATQLDTPMWLGRLFGRDARVAIVGEDEQKLQERNFVQDHYEHCGLDKSSFLMKTGFKFGLRFVGEAAEFHPALRIVFDEVFTSKEGPSKFTSNYIMLAGTPPVLCTFVRTAWPLTESLIRRPQPRAQRGRPSRHDRRAGRRVPSRHPHRGHGGQGHRARAPRRHGDAVRRRQPCLHGDGRCHAAQLQQLRLPDAVRLLLQPGDAGG